MRHLPQAAPHVEQQTGSNNKQITFATVWLINHHNVAPYLAEFVAKLDGLSDACHG